MRARSHFLSRPLLGATQSSIAVSYTSSNKLSSPMAQPMDRGRGLRQGIKPTVLSRTAFRGPPASGPVRGWTGGLGWARFPRGVPVSAPCQAAVAPGALAEAPVGHPGTYEASVARQRGWPSEGQRKDSGSRVRRLGPRRGRSRWAASPSPSTLRRGAGAHARAAGRSRGAAAPCWPPRGAPRVPALNWAVQVA